MYNYINWLIFLAVSNFVLGGLFALYETMKDVSKKSKKIDIG